VTVRLLNRDIACQQAVELVTDYLEGSLTGRQRRRFERHVRGCPNCRTYIEQIRITITTVGRVEPDSLDADVRQDLLELFRRYHQQPPAP
jgi:anti-sigma factor RsiW